MKTFITILLLTIVFNLTVLGQRDSVLKVSLVKTVTGHITDFTTDNLGNIYLISSTNQLKKLNAKGDSVAIFNDVRRYGKITSIDVTNPLKTLVYYKDFLRLVVLYRLLIVSSEIDVGQENIYHLLAFSLSYDYYICLDD